MAYFAFIAVISNNPDKCYISCLWLMHEEICSNLAIYDWYFTVRNLMKFVLSYQFYARSTISKTIMLDIISCKITINGWWK